MVVECVCKFSFFVLVLCNWLCLMLCSWTVADVFTYFIYFHIVAH